MSLFNDLFLLLTILSGEPEALVLQDGRQVSVSGSLQLGVRLTRFHDEVGRWLSIPTRRINFEQTFRRPPKPRPQPVAKRPQRRIDWSHPTFADKQTKTGMIVIDQHNYKAFRQTRGRYMAPASKVQRDEIPAKPNEDDEGRKRNEP